MPGSPRVALWPNLAACLLIAFLLAALLRRSGEQLSSIPLWVTSAAGFAVLSPAAALPLTLFIVGARLMGRLSKTRGRFRAFLEIGILIGCAWVSVSIIFASIQEALFSSTPYQIESAVHAFKQTPEISRGADPLFWSAFIADTPSADSPLPSPWALTIPLFALRLLWALWAVGLAIFCKNEGLIALKCLQRYWGLIAPKKTKTAPEPR
jgi:hypothetical protein